MAMVGPFLYRWNELFRQVEDIETVERQIKFCHLVIISKVDLIDDNQLREIKSKIREINHKAILSSVSMGKLIIIFREKAD